MDGHTFIQLLKLRVAEVEFVWKLHILQTILLRVAQVKETIVNGSRLQQRDQLDAAGSEDNICLRLLHFRYNDRVITVGRDAAYGRVKIPRN